MTGPDIGEVDPVDGSLLAVLSIRDFEYAPVLAYEFGLTLDAILGRFRRLARHRLVERVTEEPLYRVTVAGRRFLETRQYTPSMSLP